MNKTEIKEVLKKCTPEERREFIRNASKGNFTIPYGHIIYDLDTGKSLDGRPMDVIRELPYENLVMLPHNGREVTEVD